MLLLLAFVALTMRYPRAAATALVVAGWMALALQVFGRLFPDGAATVHVMVFLALPVAGAAHLIRWVTPWVSTLMALAPAGLLAAAISPSPTARPSGWPAPPPWPSSATGSCWPGRSARRASSPRSSRCASGSARAGRRRPTTGRARRRRSPSRTRSPSWRA
ncbi:hypothetical protein ACFQ0B_27500 [Nonomuraea thailandensis]